MKSFGCGVCSWKLPIQLGLGKYTLATLSMFGASRVMQRYDWPYLYCPDLLLQVFLPQLPMPAATRESSQQTTQLSKAFTNDMISWVDWYSCQSWLTQMGSTGCTMVRIVSRDIREVGRAVQQVEAAIVLKSQHACTSCIASKPCSDCTFHECDRRFPFAPSTHIFPYSMKRRVRCIRLVKFQLGM